MRRAIDLTLNGVQVSVEAEETANLLDVLRGALGVSGARFGCGLAQFDRILADWTSERSPLWPRHQ